LLFVSFAVVLAETSCCSTHEGMGGNRSVGPIYIDGRRSICSSGVLRLYVSSNVCDFVLLLSVDFDEKLLQQYGDMILVV